MKLIIKSSVLKRMMMNLIETDLHHLIVNNIPVYQTSSSVLVVVLFSSEVDPVSIFYSCFARNVSFHLTEANDDPSVPV